MLNKNELIIVNEVAKAYDVDVEVVADSKSITIVDVAGNEVFTNKVEFIEKIKEVVKSDMLCKIPSIDKRTSIDYITELNNIKFNHLKNIVLEATEKVSFKDINKAIKMLDNFINIWCLDALSLKQSQNIKTYRDLIINSETYIELQETLKDIYYMKKENNVKNNDYLISTIEEVEADKKFFKEECNKNSMLYDP